jgi:DNA polymerase-3 subunit gamma/tau
MMHSTNTHLALARKYRPQKLTDLRGQKILAKTLSNAIKSNRIHHAYLLSGIRGIGKTTTARIIAKTVNCLDITMDADLAIPCDNCGNCRNFTAGKNIDILEIDAASNTGVDGVRDIITNSKYKPIEGKYKIFIIDEVHMLSKSAFNALLKILEEPPSHVIFIFATTEVNKIPVTIISRCQRFDLRPFSKDDLSGLVIDICRKENIEISDDAIDLIALKASGSARDALSLLDQAIALSMSRSISSEIVSQMIGNVDLTSVVNIVTAIVTNNSRESITQLAEINELGKSLEALFQEILDLICYVLKVKTIDGYTDILYREYQHKIIEISAQTSISSLTILWQIIYKSLLDFKNSHSIIHSAEMALIKAIYATTLPKLDKIISDYAKEPREVEESLDSPC